MWFAFLCDREEEEEEEKGIEAGPTLTKVSWFGCDVLYQCIRFVKLKFGYLSCWYLNNIMGQTKRTKPFRFRI